MIKKWHHNNFTIDSYQEIPSTNDLMFELSSNNQINDNQVIVAKSQTNGHGRYGREWVSKEGNLYFSLLIKPENKQFLTPLLSFISCVALSKSLENLVSSEIKISYKWPNDLLINNKKVAGILLKNKDNDFIIIGIGVNITSNPQNTEFEATNLEEQNIKNLKAEKILTEFLNNFENLYQNYQNFGFAPIRNLWLKKAFKLNEEIKVNLADQKLTGLFKNLDNTGNLILKCDNEEVKTISSAQIF